MINTQFCDEISFFLPMPCYCNNIYYSAINTHAHKHIQVDSGLCEHKYKQLLWEPNNAYLPDKNELKSRVTTAGNPPSFLKMMETDPGLSTNWPEVGSLSPRASLATTNFWQSLVNAIPLGSTPTEKYNSFVFYLYISVKDHFKQIKPHSFCSPHSS